MQLRLGSLALVVEECQTMDTEHITIEKTELHQIQPLRNLFLQATNFQIRYNACHERGWSDSYFFKIGEAAIGYGSVKGKDKLVDRDAVFEFFILPTHQKWHILGFLELVKVSGATYIECQSNDTFLTSILYEYAQNISSDTILFEDQVITHFLFFQVIFRPRKDGDEVFVHHSEPVGDYLLELQGEVIATGGFLLHYNFPFADLYMEVKENYRNQGMGSFLLEEVKKACYLAGRVPAARCGINNHASKACLMKAGFKIAGYMLIGEIRQNI